MLLLLLVDYLPITVSLSDITITASSSSVNTQNRCTSVQLAGVKLNVKMHQEIN